jgi:hypothetical protein
MLTFIAQFLYFIFKILQLLVFQRYIQVLYLLLTTIFIFETI